jgi:hypothetical protein
VAVTNYYCSLSLVRCNELECKQRIPNNCYFSNVLDRTVHHEGFVTQSNDKTCDLSVSNAPITRSFFQNREADDQDVHQGGQDFHQDVAQATTSASVPATSSVSVPAATFSEAPTGTCRPQSRSDVRIVN